MPDIDEILNATEGHTPGPYRWNAYVDENELRIPVTVTRLLVEGGEVRPNGADVALRDHAPALRAEVIRQREEIARLRAAPLPADVAAAVEFTVTGDTAIANPPGATIYGEREREGTWRFRLTRDDPPPNAPKHEDFSGHGSDDDAFAIAYAVYCSARRAQLNHVAAQKGGADAS